MKSSSVASSIATADAYRALLAQLIGDEQRRVAVVDDRALDALDLLARGRAGHVGDGQALALAGRGVVLGGHRRQAGGREVGVGVDELERAELGAPVGRPAAVVLGQAQDVLEADLLARPAQRLGHRLPHRDDQRRADDRRVLGRRPRRVRFVVEQPAPQRGGRRPRGDLQLLGGELGLVVTRRGRRALHEDRLAPRLHRLVVELLDQRLEQDLLLGRVVERDERRALGWCVGLLVTSTAAALAAARQRRHRDDRGDGEDQDGDAAGLHRASPG
ncbi:MAG: hypothetical protein ACJ762_09675 [Solirubrobacteraceae bacterium]